MVYITAFMIPKGTTVFEGLGGKPSPWMQVDVCFLNPFRTTVLTLRIRAIDAQPLLQSYLKLPSTICRWRKLLSMQNRCNTSRSPHLSLHLPSSHGRTEYLVHIYSASSTMHFLLQSNSRWLLNLDLMPSLSA